MQKLQCCVFAFLLRNRFDAKETISPLNTEECVYAAINWDITKSAAVQSQTTTKPGTNILLQQ